MKKILILVFTLCLFLTGTAGAQFITPGSAASPSSLPPNGSASGDLSGSYPGPTVAKVNGGSVPASKTVVGTDSNSRLIDASSAIPTALPPNGPASGDLSGSYPGPTVSQVNGSAIPASKAIVGTDSNRKIIDATGATLSNNTTGSAGGLNHSIPATAGYNGETITLTSAQTTAPGKVCFYDSSGTMTLAQANAYATAQGNLGIATVEIDSAAGVFLQDGYMYCSNWTFTTLGAPVYISATAPGTLTQTAPASGNFVRIVGYVTGTHSIRFHPDNTVVGN